MDNDLAPTGAAAWRKKLPAIAAWIVLLLGAILALGAAIGDSVTNDESFHLTAGVSILKTGDFRLGPDHPPLFRIWAALPLLAGNLPWIPPDDPGWEDADEFRVSRRWLALPGGGENVLPLARGMIILLFVLMCLVIHEGARRLYGRQAAVLALFLAALNPLFLAHGHLVTSDLPAAFTTALALLTFTRLLERVSWPNIAAAGFSLGAAAVTKHSWVFLLPSMVVMGVMAVLDRRPMALDPGMLRRHGGRGRTLDPGSRRQRLLVVAILVVPLAAAVFLSIWTCYGWRWEMLSVRSRSGMVAGQPGPSPIEGEVDQAWSEAVAGLEQNPRMGLPLAVVSLAYRRRILPQGYLLGLARTLNSMQGRSAYFRGKVSFQGFWWYFPVAILIKTPVPILIFLGAGLLALFRSRFHNGDNRLQAGIILHLVLYLASSIAGRFNIGIRHLLPIYPALLMLAGASARWLPGSRRARLMAGAGLLWLTAGTLWVHPHHLAYFNELVGGPSRGHLYLADSNLDWGQDLKRLADYVRKHQATPVKLSYFGNAALETYGFPFLLLPSPFNSFDTRNLDGGGTYVISVTSLLGIYSHYVSDDRWRDPETQAVYQHLVDLFEGPDRDQAGYLFPQMESRYHGMRWGRFLTRLRRRAPDDRIGWSLWVYRLDAGDVSRLDAP